MSETVISGLLTHKQAARRLHITSDSMVALIRNGAISIKSYEVKDKDDHTEETWLLDPEDVDDLGVRSRAEKYKSLEIPDTFEIGVHKRLYNYTMRSLRLQKGLTQKQLGAKTGVNGWTIGRIESFAVYPTKEQANKIARELGMSADILFPEWLKEYNRELAPSILTDAHISLEALPSSREIAALPAPFETGDFPALDDAVIVEELSQAVKEVLGTLNESERRVIQLRFGLEDGRSRTLEKVGQEFGVSRARIGQIEAKALRKLRHPSRSRKLRDFL